MTIDMRPYAEPADLQRILDLKRTCTIPANMSDAPTPSELRALLEGAGFRSLPARDLRLARSLDIPLPVAHLPAGFVLRGGVYGEGSEQYQELHRAVFDGIGIGLDYHQSPAYEPDLDVIAVDAAGAFAAFCLCELHQVTDSH